MNSTAFNIASLVRPTTKEWAAFLKSNDDQLGESGTVARAFALLACASNSPKKKTRRAERGGIPKRRRKPK